MLTVSSGCRSSPTLLVCCASGGMNLSLLATALCCLVHSLPAFSFDAGSVMTARNPSRRVRYISTMPVGGFRQQRQQSTAGRQEEGLGLCSGSGSSSSGDGSGSGGGSPRPGTGRGRGSPSRRRQRVDSRRRGWDTRSAVCGGGRLLNGLSALWSASSPSSPQGDGGTGLEEGAAAAEEANEPQQLEETIPVGAAASEVSSFSATAVTAAAATSGDGALGDTSGSASSSAGAGDDGAAGVGGDRGGGAFVAGAGEDGLAAAGVGPGISWATLAVVSASQLGFVGLFGWISSSAIRQQVLSSFSATPQAAALGVAGMLPLLAYGLALDLRMEDWDWVRKIDEATSEVALQLFGSERQVAKVTGVVIPLAILIGFCEECAFRGLLPLFIAAKTGLPTAAVVALSGIIFGSLHAATLAYFVTATVSGIFFHGLLLASGNIFVPIVAHAVYDAIALIRYHVKVTARKQK